MPKNVDSNLSYLMVLLYGKDMILLNKTTSFQIEVVSPELMIFTVGR